MGGYLRLFPGSAGWEFDRSGRSAAVDENSEMVGEGDMYAQAKYVLHKIEWAIQEAGGQMSDVARIM